MTACSGGPCDGQAFRGGMASKRGLLSVGLGLAPFAVVCPVAGDGATGAGWGVAGRGVAAGGWGWGSACP
jgi:hypothetical protein